MNNLTPRISQAERDQLIRSLAQQTGLAPGPKSSEIIRNVLIDREGRHYDLGGEYHGVIVGMDNIPQVIVQRESRVLDCRHVVNPATQPYAVCDYGHVICDKHTMYYCKKCGSTLCEFDPLDEDNLPICPVCDKSDPWTGFFIVIVVVVFGLLLLSMGK